MRNTKVILGFLFVFFFTLLKLAFLDWMDEGLNYVMLKEHLVEGFSSIQFLFDSWTTVYSTFTLIFLSFIFQSMFCLRTWLEWNTYFLLNYYSSDFINDYQDPSNGWLPSNRLLNSTFEMLKLSKCSWLTDVMTYFKYGAHTIPEHFLSFENRLLASYLLVQLELVVYNIWAHILTTRFLSMSNLSVDMKPIKLDILIPKGFETKSPGTRKYEA